MTHSEFEHALLQTRPKMMATAMRFFQNKEDAEDVVQEVCVRMLERGWRDGDNTEALLIKATKNLCVSVWRKGLPRPLQRRGEAKLDGCQRRDECQPKFDGWFPPPLEGTGEAADAPLLRKEQLEQLDRAIAGLTPSEQRFIRMKGEELSIEEMAEQAGVSKRTASTMLWQAKKRLLTLLKINDDD